MQHEKKAKAAPPPGFSERLREERLKMGLSQAGLAAQVGISTPTQIGYEQGARSPDVGYLDALKGAGLDVVYVLWGTRSDRYATELMSWDVWADVQDALQDWCERNEVEIPRRQRLEIERLLYETFLSEKQLGAQGMERILNVIAIGRQNERSKK